MKKKLLIVSLSLLMLTGCTVTLERGKYKKGTYEAEVIDPYNGENNIASAKIVVDKDGYIESVYLDTTYVSNGIKTTKKQLKDDYNMQKYNPSAQGEWYEQVQRLEKYIVDNQGIDILSLDEEGKTDVISGCTIIIKPLLEATSKALAQAK